MPSRSVSGGMAVVEVGDRLRLGGFDSRFKAEPDIWSQPLLYFVLCRGLPVRLEEIYTIRRLRCEPVAEPEAAPTTAAASDTSLLRRQMKTDDPVL
jgi:hypothetical protein